MRALSDYLQDWKTNERIKDKELCVSNQLKAMSYQPALIKGGLKCRDLESSDIRGLPFEIICSAES